MSPTRPLELEILSGPLDGERLTLTEPTEWSRQGIGPLVFPWDTKLGIPQGRFVPNESGWSVEPNPLASPVSLVNRNEKLAGPVQLEEGDVLRAGTSWLLVLSC